MEKTIDAGLTGKLVSISKLSFGYPPKNTLILDSINMDIVPNRITVLLGPSGCGKTTLLNLIAGFEISTSGSLLFNGKPVTRPGPERTVVFQDAALFDWMSVRANILAGLHSCEITPAEKHQRVDELLALVSLEGSADRYPGELSGGMRQRVGLARALAPRPLLTLLDEPLGALDAMTREQLQVDLRRILSGGQMTAFMITHDIEEAVMLGDNVYVMARNGKKISGPIKIELGHERSRLDEYFSKEVLRLRKIVMDIFESNASGKKIHQTEGQY